MKRAWQILVMSLAIVSLLAPASLQCVPLPKLDHSCCASQPQLTSPSCCVPDASSKAAIQLQASDQANGEHVQLRRPLDEETIQQSILSPTGRNTPPPILLPSTILRT